MPDVPNPGFEVNLASWSKSQDVDSSLTWTRDTVTTHDGSAGSSKVVQTAAGVDEFVSVPVTISPGTRYIVSVWVNVAAFTAGALSNRGLLAIATPSNTFANTTITAVTAGWVQHSVEILTGPSDTTLTLRTYAPQGTAYWDDATVADTFNVAVLGGAYLPR